MAAADGTIPDGPVRNWARTLTVGAARVHRPRSVAELQDAVAGARRVRVVGSAHSFNDLIDTDHDLVSTEGLAAVLDLDPENRTVTVEGGIRYHTLCRWLAARGWALPNLPSIPHFSVAGACATATHGSGDGNAELAAVVAEAELVTGAGEVVVARRGDADFGAFVVSLGALGVVSRLVLDIEPAYRMAQEVHVDLPLASAIEQVDTMLASAYSVSWFLDWRSDRVDQLWRKHRLEPDGTLPTTPDRLWGGRRADQPLSPRGPIGARHFTDQTLSPLPWLDVLPHVRIDAEAEPGSELQSEYFVDRADGPAALEALARLGPTMSPIMRASEIRSVAPGDQWLSPFTRPRLALHLSWVVDPRAVAEVVPLVEEALAPFRPVPHWGKLYHLDPADVRDRHPRFPDFVAVAERLDPEHVFRNPHLDRLIDG